VFTAVLIYGFIASASLALVSMGFNLTLGISGVANFAYGSLYVVAAFGTWSLMNTMKLPYLLSVITATIFTALLSGLIYRVLLLRLRGMLVSEVIVTFAMGMAILEGFRYIGFVGTEYTLPVLWDESIPLLGVYVDCQRLIMVGVSAFLAFILWLYTRYSRIGLSFRAISQDEYTAMTLGINVDLTVTLSVAFGAMYVSLAAIVLTPLGNISAIAGYTIMINALAVCIVGGLGNNGGLILASLLIGYVQQFTEFYIASHAGILVTVLAIVFVLCIKPSGLLGKQKELEERV
jgi:branched-chain amino acid transport system permease protein